MLGFVRDPTKLDRRWDERTWRLEGVHARRRFAGPTDACLRGLRRRKSPAASRALAHRGVGLVGDGNTADEPRRTCHQREQNVVPLNVSDMTSQSRRRSGAVRRIAVHTATPISGIVSSRSGKLVFATTLVRIAATIVAATITTRVHSILRRRGSTSGRIRAMNSKARQKGTTMAGRSAGIPAPAR